jgi:hypothetical protein
MKLVRTLALVGCASLVTLSASSDDPALWLSQARAAMGGEVAKESVTSLRIRAVKTLHLRWRTMESSWEAFWEAPDKFVQVDTQNQQMGPMGSTTTIRRGGFSGDQEIAQVISDFSSPPTPRNKPNALVPIHKRSLAQLLLPLLASVDPLAGVAAFAVVPADPSVAPRPGLNLVALAAPDGTQWHLWLDATTHLPSVLSRMDTPVSFAAVTSTITMTTTERVPAGQVPSRTMPMVPPMLPPPPMVAGGPDKVLYELTLSDYRTDKGVTWPRRITVAVGGAIWESFRIGRYDVNPKINPRTFQVPK